MKKADLHLHSTYSDGSYTIAELFREAKEKGMDMIVVTNHDTTKGWEESQRMGRQLNMETVPGIEISAFDYETGRKAHILGYGMTGKAHLDRLLLPFLKERMENNLQKLKILKELGYQIEEEAILKKAEGPLYKQHMLSYLKDTNQTDAIFGEVYKTIFKNHGPCDFDVKYIDMVQAVKAIKADGGIPVLAHPGQQHVIDLIEKLIPYGLQGAEYDHYSNKAEDRKRIKEICDQRGLLLTGGSDFHGAYDRIPKEIGEYLCPEDGLKKLMEKIKKPRA